MNMVNADELDSSDMARLAGGQDAALNDLMERHAQRLFHYLLRCLHNEADAADASQEAFVRVYQHRAKFDPRQRFSTWLYAIATNLARDRHRYRARHPQVSLEATNEVTGGEFQEVIPAQTPSPSEAVHVSERAELVRQAVAALPDDLRIPLILAEYEDKPHAEISLILGCSSKAVEMRIYRARQQLRNSLGKILELT